MQRPQMLVQENGASAVARRLSQTPARKLFPVERRDVTIGGVHAYDYTPKDGVSAANRKRVLINLHGGGFMGCWPACAELESMPVAADGRHPRGQPRLSAGAEVSLPGGQRRCGGGLSRAAEDLSPAEHRHLWLLGRRHAHRHGGGLVPEARPASTGRQSAFCARA